MRLRSISQAHGRKDKKMEQAKLKKILKKHKKWLYGKEGGEKADLSGADLSSADFHCADLSSADLSRADLSGADLSYANLNRTDLYGADLSYANLYRADLYGADLSGATLCSANLSDANLSGADLSGATLYSANLSGANLSGADLSCATGILNPIDYLAEKFERTEDGYVVYKVFNGCYASPTKWNVEPGEIITEEVNFCRANECGCGINAAPLEWVKRKYPGKDIYKLLIKWEWLTGVVVPYNTDGKIRCSRAQIIGKVENDG